MAVITQGSFQETLIGDYSVSGSGADCKSVTFGFGWFDSIIADFAVAKFLSYSV